LYSRSNNIKAVVGLIDKTKINEPNWFKTINYKTYFFNNILNWNDFDSTTLMSIEGRDSFRISQIIPSNRVHCATFAIVFYQQNDDFFLSQIYKDNSDTVVCEDCCNKCLKTVDSGSLCDFDFEERMYVRWYYSSFKGRCYKFLYSGCGGNENNFVSLDQCNHNCLSIGILKYLNLNLESISDFLF
jgi:hypothetical protein